jgi:hypothetical protein
MKRKLVLGLFLAIFLVLSSFEFAYAAQASGESIFVQIKADGSVVGTDKIVKDGNVYRFIGNIKVEPSPESYQTIGISIDINDVVLDGAGFNLWTDAEHVTGIQIVCDGVTVRNLDIHNFEVGISVEGINNTVIQNRIRLNSRGIVVVSNNNVIAENYITNNDFGFTVTMSNILVYNNNFISNSLNFEDECWISGFDMPTSKITFENGVAGGNYWDGYTGIDNNGDGIGDGTYFMVQNTYALNYVDRYPLIAPFQTVNAGTWNNKQYNVNFVTSSIISEFYFNPAAGPFLWFNLTCSDSTGFCRVRIPKELLWTQTDWTVKVDNQKVTPKVFGDQNNAYLCFSYTQGTQPVEITGTNLIQDPSWQELFGFSVTSPENRTYTTNSIQLTFASNKTASNVAYILDNKNATTIDQTQPFTITGLADGQHSIRMYAEYSSGNTVYSETVYFTVQTFPITVFVTILLVIAVVVAVLLYFTKKVVRNHDVLEEQNMG